MNSKDLYQRIKIIFGGVMVFFYLGFGILIIFSQLFSLFDKFIRIFFGIVFILIGLTRAFSTYEKVLEILYPRKHFND